MQYKVLLAFDGSESSLRATNYVLMLMNRNPELKVTVLTVTSPEKSMDPYYVIAKIERFRYERALEIQQKATDMFSHAGRNMESLIVKGGTVDVICDYAHQGGYDFIVIGTNTRSKVKDVIMGSICRKVAVKARCPVTLVN